MKHLLISILILSLATACKKDYPTDEDNLLMTPREDCYVSSFELLGPDYVTVLTKTPVIDTTLLTVSVTVQHGTDLKNLFPQFTLATDCKLDPKVIGKVDFSDLANPKEYTVVSGNRQVKKTYKVLIAVQPR